MVLVVLELVVLVVLELVMLVVLELVVLVVLELVVLVVQVVSLDLRKKNGERMMERKMSGEKVL